MLDVPGRLADGGGDSGVDRWALTRLGASTRKEGRVACSEEVIYSASYSGPRRTRPRASLFT